MKFYEELRERNFAELVKAFQKAQDAREVRADWMEDYSNLMNLYYAVNDYLKVMEFMNEKAE